MVVITTVQIVSASDNNLSDEIDIVIDDEDSDALIAELAEEYCERLRAGEKPDIVEEYCESHPTIAMDIRDIFPTIAGLEIEKETQLSAHPKYIGEYKIIREIAHGGMGIVYEAEQSSLNRHIALKVIARHVMNDASRARFAREAKIIAQIEHPHVVPIYAYGEEDDTPYIAMRFIRGRDWHDLIVDKHTFSLEAICEMGHDLADGLSEAHALGIFHRDIKPGNILYDQKGQAILTDFGLARDRSNISNMGGSIAGTMRYMAPEQFKGVVDARTDVYALAISLIELITQAPAFPQKSVDEIMSAICRGPSLNKVPPKVRAIIRKGCHPDPSKRYQSALEFAEALQAPFRVKKGVSKILLTMIVVLVIAGMIAFGGVLGQSEREPMVGENVESGKEVREDKGFQPPDHPDGRPFDPLFDRPPPRRPPHERLFDDDFRPRHRPRGGEGGEGGDDFHDGTYPKK